MDSTKIYPSYFYQGTFYNTISVRGVDLFIDFRPFLLFHFFSIPGKSDEKQSEKKVSLFADRRRVVKCLN